MRTRILLLVVVALLALSPWTYAQGSKIQEKLNIGATPIAQGELKTTEVLMTRDGQRIPPGLYRVAATLNSLGEAQFVISVFKVTTDTPTTSGISSNAINLKKAPPSTITVAGFVDKNLLIRGIASNIQGVFSIKPIAPSETVLSFNSKQFSAHAILGRDLNSKLVDLTPAFLSLDQPTSCGQDCIEGHVKMTIRNEGNADAKGKWNVILEDPQFFVGSVEDVPAGGERAVVSAAKLQLPCCSPVEIGTEVHADFYNSESVDSNNSNDTRTFTLKLK
jgi:hypothetical protein